MAEHPPAERDAVEAPPWDPDRGPGMRTTSYDDPARPQVRIRVAGEWCDGRVRQRQDWPDGRVRVLCDVYLPDGIGGMAWYVRGYWWDSAAIRMLQAPHDEA